MKTVKITDLDYMGRGVTKIDNVVTFVNGALNDEIVEVEVTNTKKNYKEAEAIKIIKANEKRIVPICLYYESCGGCDLMHLSYKDQLIFKEEKVKKTLKKFANLECKINSIIPADEIFNYRNKITFHVNGKVGYFKKKTNEFVEISQCLIADIKINALMKQLNKLDCAHISEVTIRCSKNTDETMLIINSDVDIDTSNLKGFSSIYLLKNNYILKYGTKNIIERIGEFNFYISPSAFFQVNTFQAIKLYDKVKEYASLTANDNVLDLYCGTGTIGIYLSRECHRVYGIEINKDAINDANLNKQRNNIKNIDFYCENANNFKNKIKAKINVIIVDPPRGGLDNKTLDSILQIEPVRLVYVSCDVATLARDLKKLMEKYEVKEVTPVDMFPNTCHVECVCILNHC